MPFQSVPNTAEIVLTYTVAGVEFNNVLHAKRAAGYDATQLASLASSVSGWVTTSLKPLMSSSASFLRVTVRGLQNQNDFVVVNSSAQGVGAINSPCQALNVAACITLKSVFTGRSARGRFFWGGVPENQRASATTLVQTYVDAVRDAIDALIAVLQAISWILTIVSRYTNGALRPTGVTFDVVDVVSRNNLIDSQRGRLPAGH